MTATVTAIIGEDQDRRITVAGNEGERATLTHILRAELIGTVSEKTDTLDANVGEETANGIVIEDLHAGTHDATMTTDPTDVAERLLTIVAERAGTDVEEMTNLLDKKLAEVPLRRSLGSRHLT